jgi:hypothetical protein
MKDLDLRFTRAVIQGTLLMLCLLPLLAIVLVGDSSSSKCGKGDAPPKEDAPPADE